MHGCCEARQKVVWPALAHKRPVLVPKLLQNVVSFLVKAKVFTDYFLQAKEAAFVWKQIIGLEWSDGLFLTAISTQSGYSDFFICRRIISHMQGHTCQLKQQDIDSYGNPAEPNSAYSQPALSRPIMYT